MTSERHPYRIFQLDHHGRIDRVQHIWATNDAEAILQLEATPSKFGAELWDGPRVVRTRPRDVLYRIPKGLTLPALFDEPSR